MQEDLIVVDRFAVQQLCPLLEMVPDFYMVSPKKQKSPPHVQVGALKPPQKSQRRKQSRNRPQAFAYRPTMTLRRPALSFGCLHQHCISLYTKL